MRVMGPPLSRCYAARANEVVAAAFRDSCKSATAKYRVRATSTNLRCAARRFGPFQELAGHADLSTTMRYMHLSPASLNQAIRLLEQRPPLRGENGESWHPSGGKHE